MRHFLLASLFLSTSAAAQVPQVTINADAPVVGISVTESVESRPDIAMFDVGVSSTATTAAAAITENARKMTNVVNRVRAAGVEDKDIQTIGINLYPQQDNPVRLANGTYSQPRIIGYTASNTVRVRYRRLPDVGVLIDSLVGAGANNISGPSFTIDDPSARLREAREKAFASAQQQANEYARRVGAREARLLSITESQSSVYGGDMFRGAVALQVAPPGPPPPPSPVEPGRIASNVSLFAQYALER
jgi:uncharacterized protein YggE